jgi:pimeloyl-ACP methyl ester carboxylesterase
MTLPARIRPRATRRATRLGAVLAAVGLTNAACGPAPTPSPATTATAPAAPAGIVVGCASIESLECHFVAEQVAAMLPAGPDGRRRLDTAALAALIERRSLLYDKSGEEHFNLISALHKSIRNSDADAALYWLARMLEARGVDRVSLVAWSQGGPRAGGYAARNPGKVARLVVLAPAYNRTGPLDAPNPLPSVNAVMNVQSHADFTANWDRQVGCPDQYEPAASAAVWREMLASDPVGSTWGTGVRRAPQVPTWGFNQTIVSKMQTPFLMVAGVHDKQVTPERVRDLYTDLGAKQKVLVDLACSSHNAMWERNHLLLFRASLEWLRDGQVNGMSEGELKLGYEPTLAAGRLR